MQDPNKVKNDKLPSPKQGAATPERKPQSARSPSKGIDQSADTDAADIDVNDADQDQQAGKTDDGLDQAATQRVDRQPSKR